MSRLRESKARRRSRRIRWSPTGDGGAELDPRRFARGGAALPGADDAAHRGATDAARARDRRHRRLVFLAQPGRLRCRRRGADAHHHLGRCAVPRGCGETARESCPKSRRTRAPAACCALRSGRRSCAGCAARKPRDLPPREELDVARRMASAQALRRRRLRDRHGHRHRPFRPAKLRVGRGAA